LTTRQVLQQKETGLSGLLGASELIKRCGLFRPLELVEHFPGEPFAASDRRPWVGIEALRYRDQPPNGAFQAPLTHHSLILFLRTPSEFESEYEGISQVVPPPTGSIPMVPAGSPARWRWGSHSDSLHVFLEPELIARVAGEAFGLDTEHVSLPPLDGLHLPALRAPMLAVNKELMASAEGSLLAAESLANLLAVHVIRYASAPHSPARRTYAALPPGKLRAVVAYIEDHLHASLTLEQMAATAHLSAYHFARRFKEATGLPPHQYVIARRVERAPQLLQQAGDLSLAQIAACVGFSDQSQFSHHFKRVVGVTPR
jgi:AraC family transcriptional regulator